MCYMTKEKPYNSLDEYYKKKYGKKVAKIPLNASFTCPNRDGTKGKGGCIFCSSSGSGDFAGDPKQSIKEQYNNIKAIINKKWNDCYYIPYFQANSNTYGSLARLKFLYDDIMSIDSNIVELSIATRPDCLSNEIISYLSNLNKKIPVQVELGLQTSNERTANFINRCYPNSCFETSVHQLRENNIEVVVHIINGLPYEEKKDMIDTIHYINKFDIQGIKIHSMLILKNTKLYEIYQNSPFHILTLDEYVDIVCEQISILKSSIIIHRLAADGKIEDVVAPLWSRKKLVVLNEINKKMRKYNLFQGIKD